MSLFKDAANDQTDRRLAISVSRWTGLKYEPSAPLVPYTRSEDAANRLRRLMEPAGAESGFLPMNHAFLYFCRRDNKLLAVGLGETQGLAICDGFRWAQRPV
jgi:hypothetical protein